MASALAAQSCMARLVWMHIQRPEQRHDLRLVLGPQPGAPVGDAGDDDLDLPIGQLPGHPRVAGGRQVEQPPADLEDPVGGLVGPAELVAAPRRHRRVALVVELVAAVELGERQSELGREGRVLLGDLDHRVGVGGDHEGIDRFGEPQLHPASVHQFDRVDAPQNGL